MAVQSEFHFKVGFAGEAKFDVIGFELVEAISQPFRLELGLSSFDPNCDLDGLRDTEATFTIERDGEPVRQVHGIVTMFEQGETGFRGSPPKKASSTTSTRGNSRSWC